MGTTIDFLVCFQGSLDGTGSRPITPPQVPEVLPPNVKVRPGIV